MIFRNYQNNAKSPLLKPIHKKRLITRSKCDPYRTHEKWFNNFASSKIILYFIRDSAVAQAVGHQSLMSEARDCYKSRPCGNFGGQWRTGTVFASCTSVLPCELSFYQRLIFVVASSGGWKMPPWGIKVPIGCVVSSLPERKWMGCIYQEY